MQVRYVLIPPVLCGRRRELGDANCPCWAAADPVSAARVERRRGLPYQQSADLPRLLPQASKRTREPESAYQSRRGHAPQISISDPNHHVTEAIGDMYGDAPSPDYVRHSRPLSFVSGPSSERIDARPWRMPSAPTRMGSKEAVPQMANGPASKPAEDEAEEGFRHDGPVTTPPPVLNRNSSDTASHEFEMNLDYSKPEDVAQELSNLQAIRRMSMDVNSQDPDLPSFNPNFRMPALAPPAHGADDQDPSRLFWVPARLHPELAPKEFKTFIEDKVRTIKRTSAGEEELLSADGPQRQGSAGSSLRRKKSMLSRQIDSGAGYEDGADRLERKRSRGQRSGSESPPVGLKDLESVLTDPTTLARKMSTDRSRDSFDSGVAGVESDAPVLPRPAGSTLKRSTRTQYRRGSLRKGEKLPFSKRLAAARQTESDSEAAPSSPGDVPELPILPLSRIQTEPVPPAPSVENFSRPGRGLRTPPGTSYSQRPEAGPPNEEEEEYHGAYTVDRSYYAGMQPHGRNAAPPGSVPVPQIVETPPPVAPAWESPMQHPARSSSRGHVPPSEPPSQPPQQPLPNRPRPMQQPPRPAAPRHAPLNHQGPRNQTFDDIASRPSPLPGSSTRTDALSVIPTMTEDKEKKKPKSKEEPRKASWGWLGRGSEDREEKEKEKERERREREERESARKAKSRSGRGPDASDSGRLDVLQQSIDGGRQRESLVLDRSSVRLEEERRKESNRKSGESNAKKEKDSIFSTIFGGGKRKEKEYGHKKGNSMRGLSPEPPPRILKPDVDYNWTRFSIMEERAIYRMAHIKLANPRRELYSQVLLSNFMYSYLAKVQSQHPQLAVPATLQQKRQQQAGRGQEQGKEQQQPEEFAAYQRYQEVSARAPVEAA